MPPKEMHKIQMMYAIYEDGMKEPIVIDEIKDLTLEEAVPILEEHNFVKVVRCKDCKHYKIDHPRANGYHCCYRMHSIFPMKPDGFCSYGERREDAEAVNTKIKHRRFCKLNNYYCPDCIYHHFVWDGVVFRGNVCLYGRQEALPSAQYNYCPNCGADMRGEREILPKD